MPCARSGSGAGTEKRLYARVDAIARPASGQRKSWPVGTQPTKAPRHSRSSTGSGRRNRMLATVGDELLQPRMHLVPAEAHRLRLLPLAVNDTQAVADASERMQEIPLGPILPG